MTRKQYLRLTIVVFAPLLAAGWLLGLYIAGSSERPFITCEENTTFENCRNVGWEGSLHESVLASHPAWFELRPAEGVNSADLVFSGSKRVLNNSTILSTQPYALLPASAQSAMTELEGRVAAVQLGLSQDQKSQVSADRIFLVCNSLRLLRKIDEFESECFGNGWAGPIKLRIGGSELGRLSRLRAAIEEEIDDQSRSAIMAKLIIYPSFLYLYFALSALIWLTIRASRWVKAAV